MTKMPISNRVIYVTLGVILSFFLSTTLKADEKLFLIANDPNMTYFKPEVKISSSNEIYMVYQAQNINSGRSDIYLSKYSAGKVSFLKNVSESNHLSYEPDLEISINGHLHVAWADETGNEVHTIKYRTFNGSNWSNIINLGQVSNTDYIEDLRMAVDSAGNAFVVFMHWPVAACKFISKYGNNISFESFPVSGRSKHPDVGADQTFVHIVWQYKDGSDYTIAYQRRPNAANSNWQPWINLDFYVTQRPRMSVDSAGIPHVVFFHKRTDIPARQLIYQKWEGTKFSKPKVVSNPSEFELYHYCDVAALNSTNIIATLQKGGWSGGKYIGYNWKRGNEWKGFSYSSKTYGHYPVKQSVDLATDRYLAAIAFAEKDEAVYLLIKEEGSNPDNKAPIASFTFSPQIGNAPLDVTFDATDSTDPDGHITHYQWNFGDGSTGTGQITTHKFVLEGTYTVTLTVSDNDGKSNSVSHQIIIEPPNEPPVANFSFSPTTGLYPLEVTFDASTSTDIDGTIVQYEWDFGDEQTGSGQIVSHTYNQKGMYTIMLTVYDDDNDFSSASATIQVLGLLPPLNIRQEVVQNRNLFTIEFVAQITWDRNPGNADRGSNVTQYKIYRMGQGETQYIHIDTVPATDNNTYFDRLGNQVINYHYTVTALDDMGRESELPDSTSNTTVELRPKDIKE
jgi:PKD repeat protein